MKIRISEHLWTSLATALLQRRDVETAGVLLCEPVPSADGQVLVVREALPFPEHGYIIRKRDQLKLDPVVLNRLIRPARDAGWSVVTVHTHPGDETPMFSWADNKGDARLMPSLQVQMPDVRHGSMVIGTADAAVARLFREDGSWEFVPIVAVGRTLHWPGPPVRDDEGWFDWQRLALGPWGHARLRQLRVGVVGAGGTGSVVGLQLAHMGIGHVVVIDGDVVEKSNVSRIAAARANDSERLDKVAVMERYVDALGLGTTFKAIPQHLSGEQELRHLRDCDVVFSCVDRHAPRALLNRFAYQSHVPVIDMGTAFRVDETGQMIGNAGRVVIIGPGRPCLGCWGHIDADALRAETLPPDERDRLAAEGYIAGADVAQPSVMAFNTMVAGAAVVELLRLVTAFAGAEAPPNALSFSYSDGVIKRATVAANPRCTICGNP